MRWDESRDEVVRIGMGRKTRSVCDWSVVKGLVRAWGCIAGGAAQVAQFIELWKRSPSLQRLEGGPDYGAGGQRIDCIEGGGESDTR